MLSYIVRIANVYQTNHGHAPNTLILSKEHMLKLTREYLDADIQELLDQLDVNLLIVEQNSHPQVGWFERQQHGAMAQG